MGKIEGNVVIAPPRMLVKCGYRHYINVNSIIHVAYYYDKDGGDTEVILHTTGGTYKHYLDEDELAEFLEGMNRALI